MSEPIRLCALDDLADGEARPFEVSDRRLSVVRLGEDVYVLGDTCSHADVSLSEGEVDADECTIECWKHGSLFSLETGEALTLPATRPVPTYGVTVDGGEVVVTLDVDADATAERGGAR